MGGCPSSQQANGLLPTFLLGPTKRSNPAEAGEGEMEAQSEINRVRSAVVQLMPPPGPLDLEAEVRASDMPHEVKAAVLAALAERGE
jgi:hypothetical protein